VPSVHANEGSDILNMLPASFYKLQHEDAAGSREIIFRRVSNLKASSLHRPLNHRLQTAPTHPFAVHRPGRYNVCVYKWPRSSKCYNVNPCLLPHYHWRIISSLFGIDFENICRRYLPIIKTIDHHVNVMTRIKHL